MSTPAPCRFKCRKLDRFELTVRNPLGGEPARVLHEQAVLMSCEDGQPIGDSLIGANEEIRISSPRLGTFVVGEEYTIDVRKRVPPCPTPTTPTERRSKKATGS